MIEVALGEEVRSSEHHREPQPGHVHRARLDLAGPPRLRLRAAGDEGHAGLDEGGRALLTDAIAAHRAGGGVVLMASHEAGLPGAGVLRLEAAA